MNWLAKNKYAIALCVSLGVNFVLYTKWDLERMMTNYTVETRARLIESMGKHGGIDLLEKVTEDMQLYDMERQFDERD